MHLRLISFYLIFFFHFQTIGILTSDLKDRSTIVSFIDITTGEPLEWVFKTKENIQLDHIFFSSDGNYVGAFCSKGIINLWKMAEKVDPLPFAEMNVSDTVSDCEKKNDIFFLGGS